MGVFLLLLATACSDARPDRPDILLITWDTVRHDRLGPAVTPWATTLAANGVNFSEARTTYPLTLPAHASLLTGRYPASHGARHNGSLDFRSDIPLLQERLKTAGWATGGFVSASVLHGGYGLGRGLDVYDDTMTLGEENQGRNYHRSAPETLAAAAEWMAGLDSQTPMFLWVHLFEPHQPWTAPEPFSSRHPDPYDAEIAYTDELTGRFLGTLEEHGRGDHLIVALTSDHGEGLGEHGEQTHGTLIYDSTMRVPLVIAALGTKGFGWRPGRTVDDLVSLVDVAPTLAALAGVGLETAGISLVPLLEGGQGPEDRSVAMESLAASMTFNVSPLFGVVTSDGTSWIQATHRERYDLSRDRGQLSNLYQDADATRFDQAFGKFDWGTTQNLDVSTDPETLEQLAALGYVVLPRVTDAGDQPRENIADMVDVIENAFHYRSEMADVPVADRAPLVRLLMGGDEPPADRVLAIEAWNKDHDMIPELERERVQLLDSLGHFHAGRNVLMALVSSGRGTPADDEELQRRVARLEEEQQLAVAIEQRLKTNPGDLDAGFDLGMVLYHLERFDESEAHLRAVLGKRPDDQEARKLLIKLLQNRDRTDEAEVLIRQAPG